jgi:D-alanyl-lipoteichoic acid acyltransferase DltB (MBOAT superfamily)
MLFHTWVFFVFFLIVYPAYLVVRRNNLLMNLWLMLASYVFYGSWWFFARRQNLEDCWQNPYLLLLFGTSAIDYVMVLFMQRSQSQRWKRLWLIISLVSNFGFLGYFKYSGFITDNLNGLLAHLGSSLRLPDAVAYPNAVLSAVGAPSDWLFTQVVLPVGISFHTFQSMSYTIDAYRGTIQTERNFVRFLTFVSFFPFSWWASSKKSRWPTTWASTSIWCTHPPANSMPQPCSWPRWPSAGRFTLTSAATPTWPAASPA